MARGAYNKCQDLSITVCPCCVRRWMTYLITLWISSKTKIVLNCNGSGTWMIEINSFLNITFSVNWHYFPYMCVNEWHFLQTGTEIDITAWNWHQLWLVTRCKWLFTSAYFALTCLRVVLWNNFVKLAL